MQIRLTHLVNLSEDVYNLGSYRISGVGSYPWGAKAKGVSWHKIKANYAALSNARGS